MAVTREQRQLNLIIAIQLKTKRLTLEYIGNNVDGYGGRSPEALKKLLARDRKDLLELGIPIDFDFSELTYKIANRDYVLPELHLDAAESASVALAASLWTSSTATATQDALRKLRAGGEHIDTSVVDAAYDVSRSLPDRAFVDALAAATNDRATVTFSHRPLASKPAALRTVEPWGIVTSNRRWYLVGFDLDRDAPRTFRLSRIDPASLQRAGTATHDRPSTADIRRIVDEVTSRPTEPPTTATIWVADGRGAALRRLAQHSTAQAHRDRDGDELTIAVESFAAIRRLVLAAGPDAVVMEPPELRNYVIAGLRELIATDDETEVVDAR